MISNYLYYLLVKISNQPKLQETSTMKFNMPKNNIKCFFE